MCEHSGGDGSAEAEEASAQLQGFQRIPDALEVALHFQVEIPPTLGLTTAAIRFAQIGPSWP